MKNYLEVNVFVSPAPGGGYTVRVDSIEAGVGNYPLTLPFALGDLAGMVFGGPDDVPGAPPVVPPASPDRGQPMPSSHRASLSTSGRNFGAEMFEALFKGTGLEVLAGTLNRAQAMTEAGNDTGVRIRISMDLQDLGMVDVASLPWELMSRRDEDPLVVSDKTPLVRSFSVLHPTSSRPFQGALRILVVMSNPTGTPKLNFELERARIEESWKALNVTVDFAPPVRAELRKMLGAADYHVVHFMGHGDFDANKGGVLLFEQGDADRSPDPVSAQEFAVMLVNEPLRLVYLNACKTGTTSAGASVHPFASVAAALIKRGVPAVVAMQFPISDRAAIDFASTFYERIAQRHSVEAAVAQARNALYSDGHHEWATPVLYLRSRDGVLFASPTVAETVAASAGTAPGTPSTVTIEPVDPWGADAGDAPRVFLATPCERLKPLHRTLARELRAEGIRVVDSVPPPHQAAEHATAVRALAARAHLCVHLMGDTQGEVMEEAGSLRTYPVEQLRIALESARSQLVVIPDVDIETIDDADYKQFLRQLETRSYDAGRFELVRTGKLEVKAAIKANLQRQKDARQAAPSGAAAGPVRTAFVDSHDLDQECASDLVTFLSKRDVEAFMQTSEGSSEEVFAQFGDNLKNYPLYIIVSGKADQAWVTERTNNARSAAVAARAQILIGKYDGGETAAIDISRLKIVAAIKRPIPKPVEAMFQPPPERKA